MCRVRRSAGYGRPSAAVFRARARTDRQRPIDAGPSQPAPHPQVVRDGLGRTPAQAIGIPHRREPHTGRANANLGRRPYIESFYHESGGLKEKSLVFSMKPCNRIPGLCRHHRPHSLGARASGYRTITCVRLPSQDRASATPLRTTGFLATNRSSFRRPRSTKKTKRRAEAVPRVVEVYRADD